MVRLPERAMIFASWTRIAPMGTSPAAPAERASAMAWRMNSRSASMRERIARQRKDLTLGRTALLDNSGSGKQTTAHGRALGECIADISYRFRFLSSDPSKLPAADRRAAGKNPAWKFDATHSPKAGLLWKKGNR